MGSTVLESLGALFRLAVYSAASRCHFASLLTKHTTDFRRKCSHRKPPVSDDNTGSGRGIPPSAFSVLRPALPFGCESSAATNKAACFMGAILRAGKLSVRVAAASFAVFARNVVDRPPSTDPEPHKLDNLVSRHSFRAN